MNSYLPMSGHLSTKKITPKGPGLLWHLSNLLRPGHIRAEAGWHILRPLAKLLGLATFVGELRVKKFGADGTVVDYGVVSRRVVTTAFVNFVVDQLQTETAVFGDFKYHDSGVGSTAENVTDTAIETTDAESRATGTQTEGAANAYVSVGTIAYTTTVAIVEHGLFNDLTAGTLMDRTVFSAINVVNGDSIQFTYTLTLTAGS